MALDLTLGPFLIGVLFATLISGVVLVQCHFYLRHFSQDSLLMKLVVGTVVSSHLITELLLIMTAYSTFVTNFGIPTKALPATVPIPFTLSILFGAICSHIAQAYFIYRLHKLVMKAWVSVPLWLATAACFGFTMAIFVGTFVGTVDLSKAGSSILVTGVFICAAAVDIFTATTLVIFLRYRSSMIQDATRDILNKLSQYVIQTGLTTSIVAIVATVLLYTSDSTLYLAFYINLSGLFASSLLASLNARRYIREASFKAMSAGESTVDFGGAAFTCDKAMLSGKREENLGI